jgi:hypothetical protein
MSSDAVDERRLGSTAFSFAEGFGGLQGCEEEGPGKETGVEDAGEGEGNGVVLVDGETGNACGCECVEKADRKEDEGRRLLFNVEKPGEGRGGSGGADASLERLPLRSLDLRDEVRDRGGRGRG